MTKGGSQPNKVCVFPWRYRESQGEAYSGCANPDDDPRGLWCPTETNSLGIYVIGSAKWGYCKMEYEGGQCTTSGLCGILYPLIILVEQCLDIQWTIIRQCFDLISNLRPTNHHLPGQILCPMFVRV